MTPIVSGGGSSGGSQPAGDDGQIQFNDNDALGASPDLVWDGAGGNALLKLATAENGTATIVGNNLGVQLQLLGADGDATHVGGEVIVRAGGSAGNGGGAVEIAAGVDSEDGDGGALTLSSGSSVEWNGGDVTIRANPSFVAGHNGGDINIIAGQGVTNGGNIVLNAGGSTGNIQMYSGNFNQSVQLDNTGLNLLGTKIGFFGAAPVVQPTGVAVDAAAIHAALVTLGLITA